MSALAYILIQVEHSKIDIVSGRLMKFKQVSDVHHLYGEYDIIVRIEAEDMAALQDFIQLNIRKIKEIKATQTLIASDVI